MWVSMWPDNGMWSTPPCRTWRTGYPPNTSCACIAPYIVRLDKIHAVEEGEVTMERTERKVPIGGSFLGKVRERLDPL